MDPTVGSDLGKETLAVGRPEFLDLPVGQQMLDDRVLAPQLLERRGVGRETCLRLLLRGETETFEKDLAEFHGGVHVELLPCVCADLRSQFIAPGDERIVESSQFDLVDADSDDLHPCEDTNERYFDGRVQIGETTGDQRFVERRDQTMHPQRPACRTLTVGFGVATEIELTGGRTVAVGKACVRVLLEKGLERVTRFGRVEEVRRNHRVE
ncbi:unannotated protein [freshwater metagenome]|uniref:Unannotated protein n=1 Tax=freshwater metagenome TaxID=449393 RepID=A0A6J6GL96_9ZZZZ